MATSSIGSANGTARGQVIGEPGQRYRVGTRRAPCRTGSGDLIVYIGTELQDSDQPAFRPNR